MTLRTLNYGNYGIFLIMGNAGFCPSTVALLEEPSKSFRHLKTLNLSTVIFPYPQTFESPHPHLGPEMHILEYDTYTCICLHIYIYTHVHIHVHIHTYTATYICTCIIYVYICMYIDIYMYADTQRQPCNGSNNSQRVGKRPCHCRREPGMSSCLDVLHLGFGSFGSTVGVFGFRVCKVSNLCSRRLKGWNIGLSGCRGSEWRL